MSGMMILVSGIVILILSTAGMVAGEIAIQHKKKRLREQVYQIYD